MLMRIVCLSDTHYRHHEIAVPDGDVLIHAGDLTRKGSLDDVEDFDLWLVALPHRHKVVIAGNHDWCFQTKPGRARAALAHATYLQDRGVTIEGVRFWGSPWQPWFLDWAFNLPRGAALAEKWALIPPNTDVLITHGPPFGVLDATARGEMVGCTDLRERILEIAPRLHVFGHIHEGYGVTTLGTTTCANASNLGADYTVDHPPLVFDLVDGELRRV